MADTAVERDHKGDKPVVEKPNVESGAWTPGSQAAPGAQAHSREVPSGFPKDTIIVSDAQNVHGDKSVPAVAASPVPMIVGRNFDAVKTAAEIQKAMHPDFWSWESGPNPQKVWDTLFNLTPDEYKLVEREFDTTHAAGDKPLLFGGSEPWNLSKEMRLHLPKEEADRFDRLIESKSHNDVAPEYRVNGENLLKPGSNLKVGEMNHITLPDGRKFDAYVPKNADSRAPVIVAMHGAAGGDSVGLMAQESGLTADAERTGAIVVFAYPKPRQFESALGKMEGVAWNVPGRTNLPSAVDNTTDDRKYLDNVLDTLGAKVETAPKVGLFGFSDGGRFAQVYATDRPDRVASVVSEDGTWMNGDKAPTQGKAVMIVHGDKDATLPKTGGTGSVSAVMDWLLGTNLKKSAPPKQGEIWNEANQCKGPVATDTVGDVTTITHRGCSQPLVEYTLKNGNHAINDFKNDGSRFVQWLLGSPDRAKNFSTMGAQFLKDNIVRDLTSKPPGRDRT